MAKEYVPIFFDWLEVTQDLTAEEKGNLIDAVVAYAAGEEYEHFLIGSCKIAFRFLKGQVDRNNAISDLRSKARTNKKEENETNDNKSEETESNLPKEKEKEKEKENKKRERVIFTPPTVEEVTEYCRERNNKVDPERFIDFYASKGWKVGNQQMKDWKACVRTWEKSSDLRARTNAMITALPAQNYHQRDNPNAQDEAFERMMELGESV